MRQFVLFLVLFFSVSVFAQAQTDTPTPTPTETVTPTPTPTSEPWVYATLSPAEGEDDGQLTRFDYTYTVGDVVIWVLLLLLLISVWGMFVFFVIDGSR